ncbi:Phosphotransferase enzyme family protein [Rutstroemia sp. NJR-2017a BBW]|nr:Phosphotransferase enzyme family protein [Rutstroemia sp. NJR-2017a BBW]
MHNFLQVSSISPLGRDSNNFVYLVSLAKAEPIPASQIRSSTKPGTSSLPVTTEQIVVRLSNQDAMLNNAARVENEVAAIKLMREALCDFPAKIVPEVYAWNTAASGNGWIIQSYMAGQTLAEKLPKLSANQKEDVLNQVAEIFKTIQGFVPPVSGFGGLNFDKDGKVVTGPLSMWFSGPFSSFVDMYSYIFQKQLEFASVTPLVSGWEGTGLEERLEKLNKSGFQKLLQNYAHFEPTLIHGDLGPENILINPDTCQITAILDFDFTHIGSQADEYFYSFAEFHGIVPGPFEGGEMEELRIAQLDGFKAMNIRGDAAAGCDIDWSLARLWQKAMERSGMKSPAEIDGIGELAAVYWFLLDICPPFFLLPRWLEKRTKEQQETSKAAVKASLSKYLDRWGY